MQPLHVCPSSVARIFPSTRARCWTAVVKKDEPAEFGSQQPSFQAKSQAVRELSVLLRVLRSPNKRCNP